MIEWVCRQCDEKLEAPDSLGGSIMDCPRCGTGSKVPQGGSSAQSGKPSSRPPRTGLFDALLGNASAVDPGQVASDIDPLLVSGEGVQLAFKLVRDVVAFTDRRLIIVDRQGISGNKVEYHSIPFKSISHFAVETAGTFDRDAELKVYLGGSPTPVEIKFRKGKTNILDVQKALATAIFS